MGNMLSSGVSGLIAFQTALNTTSHNISNASTTGYSRQVTDITAKQATNSGGYYVGSGSEVSSVTRIYNDLLATQVRSASSSLSSSEIYASLSEQVNNLFGDSETGLSASLQSFIDNFQNVANSPTSSAERQTLLSSAQTLVEQFQSYSDQLAEVQEQVSTQLDSEAETITSLAQSIADLNNAIISAQTDPNNPPNDLLDQRDALIDELATHVSVTTTKQSDGSINVFIGSGQPLVVGTQASELETAADPYDASKRVLLLDGDTDVTDNMTGGTVGGLLQFQEEQLDSARNELGRIAVTVAELVNDQQNAGMDLNGELGADMFSVGGVAVQGSTENTGSASISATRTDVSELTADDYVLRYDGTSWTLTRSDTGESVAMTGSGTASDPFQAEGLSFEVSGTAAAGDSYLIRPTGGAIDAMEVTLTDPDGVAAASPVVSAEGSSNTGSASISAATVVDADNADLRTSVTIEFLSSTTYTTDGGTTVLNYTSGEAIQVNGWEVTISGAPEAGDTFTVQDNTGATGDNSNALLMANLLDQASMNGGSDSLNDVIGEWVADIGIKTSQAQSSVTAQTTQYEDALDAQQSVSGVNLDEEAANLLYYQQAYQAAAQVISVASQLFDSLLSAVSD